MLALASISELQVKWAGTVARVLILKMPTKAMSTKNQSHCSVPSPQQMMTDVTLLRVGTQIRHGRLEDLHCCRIPGGGLSHVVATNGP